jgi:MFS family permease
MWLTRGFTAGAAQNEWWVLAARFLIGVSGTSATLCRIAIAKSDLEKEQLTKYTAMLTTATSIGFIVGPALGSALSLVSVSWNGFTLNSYNSPGWLAAALGILNFLILAYCFFDKPVANEPSTNHTAKQEQTGSLASPFLALLVIQFVVVTPFSAFESILTPLCRDAYGWRWARSFWASCIIFRANQQALLSSIAVVLRKLGCFSQQALAQRFPHRLWQCLCQNGLVILLP